MAKWRSYPGLGHTNFTAGSARHGALPPGMPRSSAWAMVSCIIVKLEFPPTMTSLGSTSRKSANSWRASGNPSRPP